MRYLVVSADALNGHIRTSEHFPCIVNTPGEATSTEIMQMVFGDEDFKPRDGKQYIIIPVRDARRVTFRKPRPQYEIYTERF